MSAAARSDHARRHLGRAAVDRGRDRHHRAPDRVLRAGARGPGLLGRGLRRRTGAWSPRGRTRPGHMGAMSFAVQERAGRASRRDAAAGRRHPAERSAPRLRPPAGLLHHAARVPRRRAGRLRREHRPSHRRGRLSGRAARASRASSTTSRKGCASRRPRSGRSTGSRTRRRRHHRRQHAHARQGARRSARPAQRAAGGRAAAAWSWPSATAARRARAPWTRSSRAPRPACGRPSARIPDGVYTLRGLPGRLRAPAPIRSGSR